MEGTPAIYQGRILSDMDRRHFRAYIYDANGHKKIINSWNEFEHHMETGVWFSTPDDIKNKEPISNIKNIKPTKENTKEVQLGYKK